MERKGRSSTTATVKEAEKVQAALGRVAVTQEEEKVVRLRQGAGVDLKAPLARAAGSNAELADELLLIEMQLLRGARAAGKAQKSLPAAPPASSSAAKDKIVRALRKKK